MSEADREMEEIFAQIEAVLDAAEADDLDTVYDHRAAMRCVSAAIRDHLQATVGVLPNSGT